jgi:N-acetylglucosaminyldiphosphoundecaprenol N-acetyl-beta-D-mannosaminyltransferase
MMPEAIHLLGVQVHAVTMAQTLAWIEGAVAERSPRQICTANPEFVMTAQRDREFFRLLNQADLVIPDGVGLLWAARQQGAHLPERVAGSDLIYRVAEVAARHGWRLYFLGAAEGVAQRAAEILLAKYPGWVLAGAFAGSPRLEENALLVTKVKAARPDVLMVAYGAPAQDKWVARNLKELDVPVSLGVGGSFDFVAGVVPRAPAWLQHLSLEWLYRLWKQPWRLRRILSAVVAFPLSVLWRRWTRSP